MKDVCLSTTFILSGSVCEQNMIAVENLRSISSKHPAFKDDFKENHAETFTLLQNNATRAVSQGFWNFDPVKMRRSFLKRMFSPSGCVSKNLAKVFSGEGRACRTLTKVVREYPRNDIGGCYEATGSECHSIYNIMFLGRLQSRKP